MDAIPELHSLIKPMLNGAKVTSCKTKSLIANGENYGSIMLAVDLILDTKEELHLVAKMCPTSEFIKQMFNIGVTFKKEVVLYKTIVPTLQDFQRRNNCTPFNSYAKCYGSRYSLDPNKTEVDDGCCLILENIKVKGFDIEDRMVGFNLDCSRFLVQDLAKFHAVPVAFKMREPENFKKLIYENIRQPNYTRVSLPEEEATKFVKEVIARAEHIERYRKHLGTIEEMMIGASKQFYEPENDVVEPYASIVHSDYWTNNTMIKKDASGKCIANCFVDFQMLIYANPFSDLMFFLYSSVQLPVLKEHYQEFIDLYYDTFIQVLKDHKVEDLGQFTKELYLKEIDRCMIRLEMYHTLFMLTPIYAKKEKATELSELDMAAINDRSKMDHEKYYARLEFCLDDFVKRGWLKLD